MSIKVHSIRVYPIKSLDGVEVEESKITEGGSLQWDRCYSLVDENGVTINAKKEPLIQNIRSKFNLSQVSLSLSAPQFKEERFELNEKNPKLLDWFSEYFSKKVILLKNIKLGYPDDNEAFGPTICSTQSFNKVADWFGLKSIEEVRRRFRSNIELENCEAFYEDQLVGEKKQNPKFMIGEINFKGINVCQRCVVPTRNSFNAEVTNGFIEKFKINRSKQLHEKSHHTQFNHTYRLTINTQTFNSEGAILKVGDILRN